MQHANLSILNLSGKIFVSGMVFEDFKVIIILYLNKLDIFDFNTLNCV